MNYLYHSYLSDPDPLCRIGNLMGDFVKGRLDGPGWHPQILAGLKQHRALDRYAHDHPLIQTSKARLDQRFGILKPVLVDIFYDHFLAKNWNDWTGGQLESFTEALYRSLARHERHLVEAFRPVARRMAEHDWLTSYRDPEVIKLVLRRMSGRLKRDNLLAEGHRELLRCGELLERDCHTFLVVARQGGWSRQS